MDIVGVVAVVSDDEGLSEHHGLVVVDLKMTTSSQTIDLDLSSAADHDSVISGGLDVGGVDTVSKGSTQSLD